MNVTGLIRYTCGIACAGIVAAAAIAPPAAGSAAVPGVAPAPTASKYEVCNFDEPTVPVANPRYPFSFLLTTKLADTRKASIRRAVRSVQEILRAEGFKGLSGKSLKLDGSYGPNTAHAVKTFQRRMGLVVDGKVGPQTWKRLGKEYCWKYH